MTLTDHAASYIEFQRATGLSFQHAVPLLASFAAHAEAEGEAFVRAETCVAWASQAKSSRQRQRRLRLVRQMAVHLYAEDERHEVPHMDALGRGTYHRPPPRLLSPLQVRQLMDAASQLPPVGSLTPVTFHYLFGLLASTGMRRSEATGLTLEDVTPDGLRIRKAKFGRARLLPLHASVRSALQRYMGIRLRCGSRSDRLFVLGHGRPVRPDYLTATFIRLARQLGLRGGPGEPGTRLHDLRHGFAMRALESAASGGRSALGRHLLALSTYLGHASPAHTYWYLEAMTDLARPLTDFLTEHLPRDRGLSPHTVASYTDSFRLLAVFAAQRHGIRPCRLQVSHLDTATLLAFLDHLETERGNGVRTRNARLVAIKSFFRYLEFRHPECLDLAAQVHALPRKRGDQPPVDYLSRAEVRALLDAPEASTVTGLRDRAMLCLAYNAGLRVSELVGLALNDLETPGLASVRVLGKGRRGRVLPLWKETRAALRAWLRIRPQVPDGHLFLNAYGTGMTRRGFAKRVALHVARAACAVPSIAGKTVTPHSLRHACALSTLEATGDIRQVGLWLGHASLQSTEMYLRVDLANKLEILSSRQPPNLRKGSFDGVHDELLAMLAGTGPR